MVKGGHTPLFYTPLCDNSDTCDNSDPCAEIEFNHFGSGVLTHPLSDNSDTKLCPRYIFTWLKKTDAIFRFESDLEIRISSASIPSGVFLLPYFTVITFLLVCRRLPAVARSPPLKIRTSCKQKNEISYWSYRLLIYTRSILYTEKNVPG